MLAGAFSVDITPPLGTPMAGYGERKGVSQGVHDPLHAAALALDDGERTVALAALDWIGVDAAFTAQVRELVAAACPIPPEAILVACSHTHSGPDVRQDAALRDVTARKVAGAIAAAYRGRGEARLSLGQSRAQGIGANRRDPQGPVDDTVTALRVDGPGGLAALLLHYACHPTVLDFTNLLISADYPGAAKAALRAVYGSVPLLFLNGAAADVSTRHTRRESTFAEAARLGRILAGAVLQAAESAAPLTGRVQAASTEVDLPLRKLPDEAAALQAVQAAEAELARLRAQGLPEGRGAVRTAEVNLMGARGTLNLVRQGPLAPVRAAFQALALGESRWFCSSGEVFTATGQAVRALAPGVRVVTYANGSVGYILPPEEMARGGYEAGVSRLAPEAAGAVVEAARSLLGGLSS